MLYAMVISALLTALVTAVFTPLYRKLGVGQFILKYVEEHKGKSGTPTCGGLFFSFCAIIVYYSFNGFSSPLANVSVAIGTAYMIIGLTDDLIKIKTKDNLGLKAYQKIIFQTGVAVLAGIFTYRNGVTVLYLPFSKSSVDIGVFTIPLTALIFIATTNSVNLTDGLDGLASSCGIAYIISAGLIILLEITAFNLVGQAAEQFNSLAILCFCIAGSLMGFLLFNVNKAKIFMGDTGSMALGGFFASVCIFSGNSLFIPLLGIMFVFSSISVIIQVIVFKKSKKRVFLMAPFHHHLQKKGLSEAKIAYIYFFITAIIGALLVSAYL